MTAVHVDTTTLTIQSQISGTTRASARFAFWRSSSYSFSCHAHDKSNRGRSDPTPNQFVEQGGVRNDRKNHCRRVQYPSLATKFNRIVCRDCPGKLPLAATLGKRRQPFCGLCFAWKLDLVLLRQGNQRGT